MTLSPDAIKTLVGERFGVSEAELCVKSRALNRNLARQVAMYLCREFTFRSLAEIAKDFGCRHHGAVLHASRRIQGEIAAGRIVATVIEEIVYALQKLGYVRCNGKA